MFIENDDFVRAPNAIVIACSVSDLPRDLKRMLRVQYREFLHYLDESVTPSDDGGRAYVSFAPEKGPMALGTR